MTLAQGHRARKHIINSNVDLPDPEAHSFPSTPWCLLLLWCRDTHSTHHTMVKLFLYSFSSLWDHKLLEVTDEIVISVSLGTGTS